MKYVATYLMLDTADRFVRDFDTCDDFLHAVEQAEDAREEGEALIAVRFASNTLVVFAPEALHILNVAQD